MIKSKTVWRILFCIIAMVFIVLGTWSLVNFANVRGESEPFAKISRETTYATSPLDKNGNVNYAKYLDEKWREGVTPNENAVVLFAEIMGPGRLFGVEREAECFERIGLEPLKNDGDYFLSHHAFIRSFHLNKAAEETFSDEYVKAIFKPWTEEKYPRIADWLSANEHLEEKIRKAARRPKIYFPNWVPSFEKERHDSPAGFGEFSHFSIDGLPNFTQISALKRIALGQLDEAIIDATTVYHFGRLFNQLNGESSISDAKHCFRYSLYLFRLIVNSDEVTPDQVERIEKFIRGNNFEVNYSAAVDLGGRIRFLSAVQTAATDGGKWFVDNFEIDYEDRPVIKRQVGVILAAVDWNTVLREINETHDRLMAILNNRNIRMQIAEFVSLGKELEYDSDELFSAFEVGSVLAGTPISKARWMVKLFFNNYAENVPDYFSFHVPRIIFSIRLEKELSLVAIALEKYRLQNDHYPGNLATLVPAYLKKLPSDPFGSGPFKYRLEEGQYLLSSVGPNEIDEVVEAIKPSDSYVFVDDVIVGAINGPIYRAADEE